MATQTTYVITDASADSVVEIKSSKSREVKRNVDRERRPSVQREEVKILMERRGSRDAPYTRRHSVLTSTTASGDVNHDQEKRRQSCFEAKKKVCVIVG